MSKKIDNSDQKKLVEKLEAQYVALLERVTSLLHEYDDYLYQRGDTPYVSPEYLKEMTLLTTIVESLKQLILKIQENINICKHGFIEVENTNNNNTKVHNPKLVINSREMLTILTNNVNDFTNILTLYRGY